MTDNLTAFLSMIAWSEGTAGKCGDDGYSCLVGGTCFSGYDDHPRISVLLPNLGISSTAAGRYQVKEGIYDYYRVQLKLPDFSPVSQDEIAIQLIKECRALDDISLGEIDTAIHLCNSRWASLPGNDYGQHTNTVNNLLTAYQNAGGTLAQTT